MNLWFFNIESDLLELKVLVKSYGFQSIKIQN